MDGGIFNTFFVSIHQSLITVPQTTYSNLCTTASLLPTARRAHIRGCGNLERPRSIIHLFKLTLNNTEIYIQGKKRTVTDKINNLLSTTATAW